uniref:RUS family member 1 n=1 Tax=Plectus sambesii TaxID=2011161 RepID=A0A914UPW7_9BILA
METASVVERYGGQNGRSIEWDARVDKHNSLQPIGHTQRRRSNQFSLSYFKAFFMDVFLPQGYPESVTDDYMEYQMWDTIQAFASSITGALATEAVLKGAGVGDETATALAATMTWLMKDGTGMVGRIIFAWARGTQLDSDCKKWRLVADILNDTAIMIDLLAPHFRFIFTYLVCLSSLCRSIVGVAGGATRAALTQHQVKWFIQ